MNSDRYLYYHHELRQVYLIIIMNSDRYHGYNHEVRHRYHAYNHEARQVPCYHHIHEFRQNT